MKSWFKGISREIAIQTVLSTIAYFVLLYHTPRTEFVQFFALYTILFVSYFVLNQKITLQSAVAFGIVFRLVAWLSWPELSDDFYRFVWDGLASNSGI
ncbi:MAG: hypothetical protein ACPGD5_02265, partial [Salibacteraceae bacterium]